MKLIESLITFQNKSEREFEESKNIQTVFKYILAYFLFIGSTLFAAFTLPFRLILKLGKSPAKGERVLTITSKNMESITKKEPFLLLDFWAEWCGPCIMMNPILEELLKVNTEIKIGKVNADLNQSLLKEYRVKGIPQFILLKYGKETRRNMGPMTIKELQKFIKD